MTIIGDHTDYNAGLSLPMAIELATEVAFTPKPGSFLVGIDSDQFPGRPVEIMLGDTAPVRAEAALAAGLLATAAATERRCGPGHQHHPRRCRPVLECRVLGGPPPRARARRRPARAGPGLPGGRARRRRPRRPARSSGHCGRHGRTRPLHRLRHPRDAAGGGTRDGGLRHCAQRGAPPPHQHPLRRPARRVRAGRAHCGAAPRPLHARRPQRAARVRCCAVGPVTSSPSVRGYARPSGCWPAATSARWERS